MIENSKKPKISVIMPNYNCEKYIGEAIESILNQTFSDFEFIIIDDGSTDNSWNIIEEYAKKDNRIIAIKNEENKHIVYTRNRGLKISKGKYIAFLDSDDIAYENRFEKEIEFLEKNMDYGICGSSIDNIDKNVNFISKKIYPETDIDCKNAIWFRNPFAQSSVLVKKECFEEVGLYDDNFRNVEDLEMWIRIGKKYKLYNFQESLIGYRIFGENSILKQQKLMIKNTLKARRKAIKLGYKITFKGIIFYIGTWFMQFLPPKFVLWLFNKVNK